MSPSISPREVRFARSGQIRVNAPADGGGPIVVEGYAAVFDSLSEDLGGFREKIAPGFFSRALPMADCRALINHEPWPVLGRTKAGTLKLSEDATGLRFELALPDIDDAQELATALQRGDLDAMSFGFVADVDQWDYSGQTVLRTLVSCRELFDISFATYPAYPDTSAAVRSMRDWRTKNPPPKLAALRTRLADLGPLLAS